ncbi:MAG: isochorismate synthase [Myxococcota bacterium]
MSLGSASIDSEHLAPGARLVRIEVPLPHADPWTWAGLAEASGEPLAAWSDEDGDVCFLALGEAASVDLPAGPGRFEAARSWCSRLSEQIATIRRAPGRAAGARPPLALGGVGFSDAAADPSGPWRSWGAGRLVVPRLLVHRSGGRTVAVLTESVGPGSDPEAAFRPSLARLDRTAGDETPPGAIRPVETTARTARDEWMDGVRAALDRLDTGDDPGLRKVVLARAARFAAPDGRRMDPVATARALRERHRACTTFAFRAADGSAFVGATPEVLIRLRGRRAATAALAGTTSRGASPEDDRALADALRRHGKDRREHGFVVEAIRDALAPLARDLEVAPDPRVRPLADVQHLETPVVATLDRACSIWDLLARLHPTPAVGGLPRGEALAWIRAHEALERGWYAAPVGWVDEGGDGAFHVALRSALLRGPDAWAFAGAGLVPGSDPEAEWTETDHKLRAIRSALAVRPEAT